MTHLSPDQMDPNKLPSIDVEKTAQNISKLRDMHGLTRSQLAHALGAATQTTVQHWEQGYRVPNVDYLVRLSALFRVPMDCIIATTKIS